MTVIRPGFRLPVGLVSRTAKSTDDQLASRKTEPTSSVPKKRHLVTITVPDGSLTSSAAICGRIRQLVREQVSLRRAAAWTRRSTAYRSRLQPTRPTSRGPNTVCVRMPSHLLVNPVAIVQRCISAGE
ncbi:hypothetical protein CMQ_3888 [Grosmannia clavigera kw1407]|uniref:Uncharacterized protein n=1 Tax=Grosmannia clavigera (strain kw1407 / UAMH 11150) TaxID=655863 RepID=F0X8V9_GROCL|nr:uncharacterized protein CMQ_3888 [Grosmannia clavigera kw1407]EFX05819.1 hypothetical protein CMQ_3888 [Grosmannia clavigera kw1407]